VRDHLDLVGRHVVDLLQKLAALLGHDHHPRGDCDNPVDYSSLNVRGLRQDRMQRCHHRHAEPVEQREDVIPGFAAEDAELVLERDNIVPAVVQHIRRIGVVLDRLVGNLEPDLCRIVVRAAVVGHRDDAGFDTGIQECDGLSQIGREGRDAAATRQGVSDESNALGLAHVLTSRAERDRSCDIAESAATGGEATPVIWDLLPLTAAALPSRKSELHSLVADRFPECQVITRQAVAVGSETTHA
jgi:hypothetical protein